MKKSDLLFSYYRRGKDALWERCLNPRKPGGQFSKITFSREMVKACFIATFNSIKKTHFF